MRFNIFTLQVLAYGVTALKLNSQIEISTDDGLASSLEMDSEFDQTMLAQTLLLDTDGSDDIKAITDKTAALNKLLKAGDAV